ncbi:MAG: GIY-YIG nuclease family protein, partial [Galbitalea sp.]
MYILECRDGTFYVGSTVDLEARLHAHATGAGAEYTRHRLPVRLVFCEEFERVEDAFAVEKKVQNWSHAKRLALIEGRFEDLRALSRKRFRPRA